MYNVSDQTQQNTKGKSLLIDNIILYLLTIIQEQHQQICWLILFICRYIPLKQWAHDELHSPKYQKFLTDKLPIIKPFIKQDWLLWNEYYRLRYGKAVKQYWKYKLRYLYREFSVNFFDMDLSQLPKWATSFKYKKNNAYIMGLCLTYRVNLKLSLRQTVHALKDIHGIDISHTMVNNYAKTAAVIIKPFVDSYDYNPSNELAADETYIKISGVKAYVWLIMDKVSRSILGYQVSTSRDVGPCILTMRMAFDKFKEFPGKALKFIADGYSAYPLAAQQFKIEKDWEVFVTQVIGLTNDDEVSKEFRPFKQLIERLNRTFKESYRITYGYGTEDGAVHSVSLWVAYYNFLRPHEISGGKEPLNKVELLEGAGNMPGKWQLLIYLGQQAILKQQSESTICS